jgi:hypothetical protein
MSDIRYCAISDVLALVLLKVQVFLSTAFTSRVKQFKKLEALQSFETSGMTQRHISEVILFEMEGKLAAWEYDCSRYPVRTAYSVRAVQQQVV